MEQAITALGKDGFVGVYAANDGTAGGAIAAMKGNGIDPKTIPTTGQDAELAAIQRILVGEQYMTVYKAIKAEAEAAAELAVALAKGEDPPSGLVNGKIDNGQKQVRSVLLEPVAVTKDNINDTDRQGRVLEAAARSAPASTLRRARRPASSRSMAWRPASLAPAGRRRPRRKEPGA